MYRLQRIRRRRGKDSAFYRHGLLLGSGRISRSIRTHGFGYEPRDEQGGQDLLSLWLGLMLTWSLTVALPPTIRCETPKPRETCRALPNDGGAEEAAILSPKPQPPASPFLLDGQHSFPQHGAWARPPSPQADWDITEDVSFGDMLAAPAEADLGRQFSAAPMNHFAFDDPGPYPDFLADFDATSGFGSMPFDAPAPGIIAPVAQHGSFMRSSAGWGTGNYDHRPSAHLHTTENGLFPNALHTWPSLGPPSPSHAFTTPSFNPPFNAPPTPPPNFDLAAPPFELPPTPPPAFDFPPTWSPPPPHPQPSHQPPSALPAYRRTDLPRTTYLFPNNNNPLHLPPLHHAILTSNLPRARALLASRAATPNQPCGTPRGLAPLHIAVATRSLPMVQLLLDAGARFDGISAAGGHSVLFAAVCDRSRLGLPPSTESKSKDAEDDEVRGVLAALVNHNPPVNWPIFHAHLALPSGTEGTTPLMAAAERGLVGVVRGLLVCNAGVETRDEKGRTALWYARGEEVVRVLMEWDGRVKRGEVGGLVGLVGGAVEGPGMGEGERGVVREVLRGRGVLGEVVRVAGERGEEGVVQFLSEGGRG